MALIVKNAVKDCVNNCNVGGDFYDALDQRVQEMVKAAEARAEANGRKTVQARDL